MEEPRSRPFARWIVRVTLFLALIGLLFVPLPRGWLGAWQGRFLDFGHVPLFAAIVLALRFGWGMSLRSALLISIGLAAVVEGVQPLIGRSGDWADFLRGCAGALAAATAIRTRTALSPTRRASYAFLAIALVVGPVVEVAPYFADTVEGHREFPVLADLAADRAYLRWVCEQATFSPAEDGARLEFVPGAGQYAFAALRPIRSDFRGYRWLCAEFRVPDDTLNLVISVRSGADSGGTTHTDIGGKYAQGSHVVRLDLATLAERGRPAPLEYADVRSVIFFVIRPPEPRAIVLTRVWLEP